MREIDNKITIGFSLENGLGHKFTSSTTVEPLYSLGESDLSLIGEQLNCFLRQCSYPRKNDYILMEDVTEEELEALCDFLAELRM